MKKFLLVCFSFCFVLSVWAQERVITGRVTSSDDGSALPGVNVVVKGTTNGTVTDSDGKFSLSIPSSSSELVFSFIGLKTTEVLVGERSTIDVQLGLDVTQLSEIVVTGVGVATEKRKLPIDVASMGAKDIPQSAVASIDQALQGKIAGAQVQLNSGQPGSAANIQLRGINSLGNTNPIILLDGVQISSGNGDSPLQGLDMTNVERIEVVKGAAAGMLYGAQGANGVIQIFTKKGAKDRKVSITVGSKVIIDEIIRLNQLNAQNHFYDTNSSGFIIDGSGNQLAPNANGTWAAPALLINGNTKNNKPYREQTFDHLDQAYRQAVSTNSTVNISGGSDKLDYSVNVNYLNQQNVRFGDLKRTNIGLNLGTELVKGFTLRSTTQLQLQEDNLLSGNRFSMINNDAYVDFNAKLPNGFKVIKPRSTNEFNPLSELEWRNRLAKDVRIIQNFSFNYKFPKFVTLDYKYGVQFYNSNNTDVTRNQQGFLTPVNAFWGPPPGTGTYLSSNSKSVYQNSLLTALINFDFAQDFGMSLPIKTVTQLTYDYRKSEDSYFQAVANGFNYPPYNLNNGSSQNAFSNDEAFTTYGYLVNQTIEYGEIAGVSVGFRSDYSSEFGFSATGDAIKAFTFPRGTVYFNPSQLIEAQFLTNWKLRAAYGEAGVQPSRYARQDVLASQLYGTTPGLYNLAVARNPALGVQRTTEIEVGTDFTITPGISKKWLGKIDVGFTYWDRKGSDIIQQANQAQSSGVSSIVRNNIGLVSNGIDITADLGVYSGTNFKWDLGVRVGTAKTTVDAISQNIPVPYGPSGLFLNRVGAPLGIMSGQYVISSLDALRPDGTPYITTPANFSVVSTQYGNIVVDNATKAAVVSSSSDLKDIGNPQPSYFGSVINDFTLFKNIQVNMQWDFIVGNKIYNQTRQWLYRDNISKDYDNPVTVAGESGQWVQLYQSLYNSVSPISWFVEDGSFARLRNLSVTYNLGSSLRGKWARQVSLTFAARNLFTITGYKGLDPESVSSGASVGGVAQGAGISNIGNNQVIPDGPARGIDSFNFPNLKSYQFGITIGL